MDAISEAHDTSKAAQPGRGRFVLKLDRWLRRRQSLIEYTNNPHCVFRIAVGRLERDVVLADGTAASAGDRVIDLHLWNEQMPLLPKQGATINWARMALNRIETSLRELAHYLAAHSEFDGISMLRGNAACGVREQRTQVMRIGKRYGFEAIGWPTSLSVGQRLHRVGENILISLIIWACNPEALRPDALRRDRVELFLSRRLLVRRYGATPASWS